MSLFKKREEAGTAEIRCSHCGHIQKIEKHVFSVFCKRCMQRIVTSNDPDAGKPAIKPVSKDRHLEFQKSQIKCSNCSTQNEVPVGALSIFCKKCGGIISLKKDAPAIKGITGSASAGEKTKTVSCYICSNLQSVPVSALSAFCSGCGNRIELKDCEIKDDCYEKVMTRGMLHVLGHGKLYADANAMSARIDGEVHGNVYVEDRIVIGAKGRIFGNIDAKRMELEKGALCFGSIRLNADSTNNSLKESEEREKAEKL